MKVLLLFTIFYCFLFVKNIDTTQDYLTAFIIRTTLNAALESLKKIGYVGIIHDVSLNTPSILNSLIMEKFELRNLSIFGFSTLKYKDAVIVDNVVENNVTVKIISINVNLSLDTLGIGADYSIDIKFLTALPLYEEGRVSLALGNIDLRLCLIVNNKNSSYKIQDLELHLSFTNSNETYITGFWNSLKMSKRLSELMITLEKKFCLWYLKEKRCIECIMSRTLKLAVNKSLDKKYLKYEKCSCSRDGEEDLNASVVLWKNDSRVDIFLDIIFGYIQSNSASFSLQKFIILIVDVLDLFLF